MENDKGFAEMKDLLRDAGRELECLARNCVANGYSENAIPVKSAWRIASEIRTMIENSALAASSAKK